MKTTIRLILWILLIIFMPRIVVGCTWWGNKTYSGRVIDADTLEPIEGGRGGGGMAQELAGHRRRCRHKIQDGP